MVGQRVRHTCCCERVGQALRPRQIRCHKHAVRSTQALLFEHLRLERFSGAGVDLIDCGAGRPVEAPRTCVQACA
eukprot:366286-Chlamydomonas_euryale.AAC.13